MASVVHVPVIFCRLPAIIRTDFFRGIETQKVLSQNFFSNKRFSQENLFERMKSSGARLFFENHFLNGWLWISKFIWTEETKIREASAFFLYLFDWVGRMEGAEKTVFRKIYLSDSVRCRGSYFLEYFFQAMTRRPERLCIRKNRKSRPLFSCNTLS